MSSSKEVAKFASGAEAFHSCVHLYFWLTGTTLTVFGITATPTMNLVSLVVNATISIILGLYAWKPRS